MKFATPEAFFLAVPWLLFCLILLLDQKRALRRLKSTVAPRFLERFTRYTDTNLWLHLLLVFGAGFALICALASPYGVGKVEGVTPAKRVWLIVDASYSMYAIDTDAATPLDWRGKTRFDVAKLAALEIATALKNDDVGLASFSGSAIEHFSPTPDHVVAQNLIAGLDIHSMRHTGSDFAAALDVLIHAAQGSNAPLAGVILSDGEPVPQSPKNVRPRLAALKAAGIPIFTVGLGSGDVAAVDLYDPEDLLGGVSEPRVAKTIETTRDAAFLRDIADKTGGAYFELEDGVTAGDVAAAVTRFDPITQSLPGSLTSGHKDYAGIPLAVFLALFAAEFVFLFPRAAASGVSALALFWLCGCQSGLIKAHLENENGVERYRDALFSPAAQHFERSALYRTREEIPLSNLGNDAILQKEYGRAHADYQMAIRAAPDDATIYFNDGVALFLWAEDEVDPKGCFLAKSAELFDLSIGRFEEALKKGVAAQANVDYVKKRIRDMYALNAAAKECGAPDDKNSYRSKYAPPPAQSGGQSQQDASGAQGQNQAPQNQGTASGQASASSQDQTQNQNQSGSPQTPPPQQTQGSGSQNQNASPQNQGGQASGQASQNQNQGQGGAQPKQDGSGQNGGDASGQGRASGEASGSGQSGSGLSEEEQKEIGDNLGRIKKDSADGKDFQQTGDQQMPTDKSEIDKNLYW